MTRAIHDRALTDTEALLGILLVAALVTLPTVGYSFGKADARLDAPIVCGDSLHPSGIHVVPLYRPSGPVRP